MPESSQGGAQSWSQSMSASDRIRAVAETLREPRSVTWISEEIEEWQATYDVETWEELEQSLADGTWRAP